MNYMQWFVEEKRLGGTWRPVIYHGEKPTREGHGRRKVWRSDPELVPEALLGMSLGKIAACLSIDGEFAGIEVDTVAEFFREGFVKDDTRS